MPKPFEPDEIIDLLSRNNIELLNGNNIDICDCLCSEDEIVAAEALDFLVRNNIVCHNNIVRNLFHNNDSPIVRSHALLALYDLCPDLPVDEIQKGFNDLDPCVQITACCLDYINSSEHETLHIIEKIITDGGWHHIYCYAFLHIMDGYIDLVEDKNVRQLLETIQKHHTPEDGIYRDIESILKKQGT